MLLLQTSIAAAASASRGNSESLSSSEELLDVLPSSWELQVLKWMSQFLSMSQLVPVAVAVVVGFAVGLAAVGSRRIESWRRGAGTEPQKAPCRIAVVAALALCGVVAAILMLSSAGFGVVGIGPNYYNKRINALGVPSGQFKRSELKVVVISDTHSLHDSLTEIPDGDVLIHAGDLTATGSKNELQEVNRWFGTLPHPLKLVIAGNHDFILEADADDHKRISAFKELFSNALYLHHEFVDIRRRDHDSQEQEDSKGLMWRTFSVDSALHTVSTASSGNIDDSTTRDNADWVRVFASPFMPPLLGHDVWALMREHGELTTLWQGVMDAVVARGSPLDILITHTPPFGVLDDATGLGYHGLRLLPAGCRVLRDAVVGLQPRFHVFGHVHAAYGVETINQTTFINAASTSLLYQTTHPPVVFYA